MSELDRLRSFLRGSETISPGAIKGSIESFDPLLKQLDQLVNGRQSEFPPEDRVREAVQRFLASNRLVEIRDARLVCHGLCITVDEASGCVMETPKAFAALLNAKTGVDQWADQPGRFRRCYRGLALSYFAYPKNADRASQAGKRNWAKLGTYLLARNDLVANTAFRTRWVAAVVEYKQVFGAKPCEPFADQVLDGDDDSIDRMRERLGIPGNSWFIEDLLLPAIARACGFSDIRFGQMIGRLLTILDRASHIRDRGLALIVERYAQLADPVAHPALKDAVVSHWGNPWLPSRKLHWARVSDAAREMVASWLKAEFVRAFFEKLTNVDIEERRRRAQFWLRFVPSMSDVRFALGADAMGAADEDMKVLRRKMEGLITRLDSTTKSANAFVMTLGSLVAVEFSNESNALYCYDSRRAKPFDLARPVRSDVNGHNSLKNDGHVLRLVHMDNVRGYGAWEERFDAEIERISGIAPTTPPTRRRPIPAAQPRVVDAPFSRHALDRLAARHGLRVADKSGIGGNLWVFAETPDAGIEATLKRWGFAFNEAKRGWWKNSVR